MVRLARRTIEASFRGEEIGVDDAPKKTREVCGVFVTLSTLRGVEKQLRGCIGYPYPVRPLVEAVREMALAAAFDDPRFPPLGEDELAGVVVEVSILTPPEKIEVEKPGQYPERVKIGEHGLIVRRGGRSGLLLPQVATEWGWDPEEFLCQCCVKAGLSPDAWFLSGTEVSRFRAIIFAEKTPGGEAEREEIGE